MFEKYLARTFGDPLSQLSSNAKDALEAYFCLIKQHHAPNETVQAHNRIGLLKITTPNVDNELRETLISYRNNGYFLLCLSDYSAPIVSIYPGIWLINFHASSATPFRLISAIIREFDELNIPTLSALKYDCSAREPLNSSSLFPLLYLIETQLEGELREDDLASQYGYSVAYFSRTFHSLLGISFRDYLCRKRIALAKRLLIEQPNTKIAVIALQCGYKDLSYFNRIFKKKVGLSPGKYKTLALTS